MCRFSDAVKFGMAVFAEMGGVRKAPRDETARRLVWLVVQGVYGDLSAARCEDLTMCTRRVDRMAG
jgi:hypothetical protein